MTQTPSVSSQRTRFRRLIKALASLKLAVVIVLALGGLAAWGTIVEARYNDSMAATRIVYQSLYMYAAMSMLAVSLISVMVDRWPWQKKHAGFILAHVGILILIGGAALTQRFGLDGSMTFGIGQNARMITVSPTDLSVYSSLDGEGYVKIYDREVDFFTHPPSANNIEVPLPEAALSVVDYYPYALRDEKIVAGDSPEDGAAVRFQLQNDRVNVTDWIQQPARSRNAVRDLGPAKVVLAASTGVDSEKIEGNAIVLHSIDDGLAYEIHTASAPTRIKRGRAKAGDVIETGWMGLVLRVLKVLPRARTEVKFKGLDAATPLTTAAVKVRFLGQEHWFALNSVLKLFTDSAVYIVSYGNRRVDLGFDIKLEKFTVGRYQGTMRAESYESVVQAPGVGQVTISMNEPLQYKGYTFYQASFNEDERGKPIASVLSVNRDPGRPAKYAGSLLIVFGAVYMFYFKRRTGRARPARGDPA